MCFATSAVHLEPVSDYSTEGFIAAYRRFTSRRGIVHTLYSDCCTNFIGADATLRKLFHQNTQEHRNIAFILSKDNTQWSFNQAAAPHMGGKWEAVVKSTKFHSRRTVDETVLTFKELTTLITQIEAILNHDHSSHSATIQTMFQHSHQVIFSPAALFARCLNHL